MSYIKSGLLGMAAFLGLLFLLKVLFGVLTIGVIIGAFIAGLFVAIFLFARSRGEKPIDIAHEVAQQAMQPDPGVNERRLYEQLIRLNERIRLELTEMSIISQAEEIIDLILDVVPRAMQEFPNSEATFDLERLGEQYFPQLLTRYVGLSAQDKIAQRDGLIQQFGELVSAIRNMKEKLDSGNLDQFELSSTFIKTKFN